LYRFSSSSSSPDGSVGSEPLPPLHNVYLVLGKIYYQQKDYQLAISYFETYYKELKGLEKLIGELETKIRENEQRIQEERKKKMQESFVMRNDENHKNNAEFLVTKEEKDNLMINQELLHHFTNMKKMLFDLSLRLSLFLNTSHTMFQQYSQALTYQDHSIALKDLMIVEPEKYAFNKDLNRYFAERALHHQQWREAIYLFL
jgi:hypothetical protein